MKNLLSLTVATFLFSAAPIAFADDAKDLEQAFGDLAKVLAEHRDTNSDTEVDSKNRVIADSNFLKLAKQNKEATAKLLVGQLGKKENLNLILVMQQAPAPTYVEPLNKHYGLFKDEGFKVVYRQEVLKTIAAAGKDSLPALLKVIEARAGVDIRKDEFSINQFAADQDFRTSVKLIGTIPSAKSEKILEDLLGENVKPALIAKDRKLVEATLEALKKKSK